MTPYHGTPFQAMKGASWLHEDPVNFRIASACYASHTWCFYDTGFRCALDGGRTPPPVSQSRPKNDPSVPKPAQAASESPSDAMPILTVVGKDLRRLMIQVPKFGSSSYGLNAPEGILWNGEALTSVRQSPKITWTLQTAKRASYEMQLKELRMKADFVARDDTVEQRFTVENLTKEPGRFETTSCFNLREDPAFYDCELARTYALNAAGKFVPMRSLSREGNCVRWITGPRGEELGKNLHWAVLAVVSRDGLHAIASGRSGQGSEFRVLNNTMFTSSYGCDDSRARRPASHHTATVLVRWEVWTTCANASKAISI